MLTIGLSLIMILAAVPGTSIVFASEKQWNTIEDTNVTWSYDNGTLEIEGTGATPDWSPWFEYKEQITNVVIGDGITALGERNFMKYPKLKSVTFKGSLSKIGNSAFEG